MDDMIRQMVQPLLDAFNMYEIKSPALQAEVDDFKQRLTAFAEENSDMATYYSNFAASGLQQEYTDIISKVAVASYANGGDKTAAEVNTSGSAVASSEQQTKVATITVREFLEQYRTAYNEVCKRKSKRGMAAYEKLFDVADRTDDMLEAQIILEKERLLWRIVSEDALEIMETRLEAMDPLFLATTAVLIGQIEAYNKADSQEELEYMLALQDVDNIRIVGEFTCRMNLAACLAKNLLEYFKCKEQIYEWPNDDIVMKAVSGMVVKRENIRRLVSFMQESMNLTVEDMFKDNGISIWMLSPGNIDETGRRKRCMLPENLEAYKDLLYNEIIEDISIKAILLRKPDKLICYKK